MVLLCGMGYRGIINFSKSDVNVTFTKSFDLRNLDF